MENTIFYKLKEDALPPLKKGDWIDLYTAEETDIEKGGYAQISLGISMELPDNCEGWLLPRSSAFKKYGIIMVNGMGIIDHDYKGDDDVWSFPVYATRDTSIPKYVRIAQFRVMQRQNVNLVEVQTLNNKNRGGFGSTGSK